MEDLRQVVTSKEPVRPYLTFLAAQEQGIVDLDHLTPQLLSRPLGQIVGSGQMPAVHEAGLIAFGDRPDDIYAVDHAYVLYADDKEIHLGPASKADVTYDGKIVDSGLLVLTRIYDGFQIYFGKAVTGNSSPWITPEIELGSTAIKLFGINSTRGAEPKVIDDGVVVAKLWTP